MFMSHNMSFTKALYILRLQFLIFPSEIWKLYKHWTAKPVKVQKFLLVSVYFAFLLCQMVKKLSIQVLHF